MALDNHIRNPLEWGCGWLTTAARLPIRVAARAMLGAEASRAEPLAVRRIEAADLKSVLVKGLNDLGTFRTDVIFLCLVYPFVGLILSRLTFGYDMVPLLFPLASGFALIGPVAAVGLYEMSRRHEQGLHTTWADAFKVVFSPAFIAVLSLGVVLVAIFLVWIAAAWGIYYVTLGPEPPASIGAFVTDVFTTTAGWVMIIVGVGVGFLVAILVLTISVVSFPLLLDRDVGVYAAVATSIRAVAANPGPIALWGLIIAGGLFIGSIPFLIGLVIVMPVLGHATWHLYRKLVA